jgi:hypothetical protein
MQLYANVVKSSKETLRMTVGWKDVPFERGSTDVTLFLISSEKTMVAMSVKKIMPSIGIKVREGLESRDSTRRLVLGKF